MVPKLFDTAEFTDLNSKLGRKIAGAQLLVPTHIELKGDSLKYAAQYKEVEPERKILNSFVSLWRQSPKAILKFAAEWGTLLIGDDGELGARAASSPRTEPLERWRYFSRRAFSTLNIAAMVQDGKLADLEEWRSFQDLNERAPGLLARIKKEEFYSLGFVAARGYWNTARQPLKRNLRSERTFLWCEAQVWLHLGKVRFTLEPGDAFKMPWRLKVFYGSGVLGAIALQLALTLCSADHLYTCSGCNVPYLRDTRRPRADQKNFCEHCRTTGTPLRKADERRRLKKAEARRLSGQGLNAGAIAEQLSTKVTTIQGWLRSKR